MAEHQGAAVAGFAVGVDLGTSNTVAVMRWPDGRTRPLLFDGAPVMPSGVFANEMGYLIVGQDAQRLARQDPACFEPNPKRRIDEPTVLLGTREFETADLLGALLAAVARAAVEAVGFLPPAVLTHPAAWGPQRRAALATAAQRAGWPPPLFLPEPVAAARYFADVLRRPVPVGSCLAVFDLGGGTLDVAVVRNDGGQDQGGGQHFVVVGSGGVENLGGLDIDAALVEHLGKVIGTFAPGTWTAITQPETATQRRNRRMFWEDVRGTKEMLSRVASAPVAVPGRDEAIHLTRGELELIAQPLLRRAVAETLDVLQRCQVRPEQLAGLFLVGGSSRLPIVARLLHSEVGIAPTVLEQPELPVAEGALAALPLVLVGDQRSVPVGPDFTVVGAGPAPRRPWYRRPVWISAITTVVVGAMIATGFALYPTASAEVSFVPLVSEVKIAIPEQSASATRLVSVRGNRAYVALAHDDTISVGAFDLEKNAVLWELRPVAAQAGQWLSLTAAAGGLVLRGESSSTRAGRIVVLDVQTGAVRWDREVDDGDSVDISQETLILGAEKGKTTLGLDWKTGTQRWNQPDPTSSSGSETVTNLTTLEPGDLDGPSAFGTLVSGQPGADGRPLLQFTSGKRLIVRNAGNGNQRRVLSGVGEGYGTKYLAYDGKFYVAGAGEAYRIDQFDTVKGGTQETVYQAPSGHSIKALVPCGNRRVCALETVDITTEHLVVVDVAKRAKVWEKEVKGATTVVPVGSHIIVGDGGDESWVFDAAGALLLDEDYRKDTVGVRVSADSALLFSGSSFSTSVSELSLTGLGLAKGGRTPLGTLKVAGKSCSWSSTHLVCPTETEFRTWRFAK